MTKGVTCRLIIGAVAALVLAACGSGGSPATQSPDVATGAPIVDRDAVLHRIPSSPTLNRLRASLRAALRRSGRDSGAAVYDLTQQGSLFAQDAGVGRPPASVEKLYTTVALLSKLGPAARLRTSVFGTGHLGSGTWHGNLYLRGGGDPTLGDGTFNKVWEYGSGPTLAQLAVQLRKAGIQRVSGQLFADESLYDTRRGGPQTHFGPDIPDFGGQLTALPFDHGASATGFTPATFAARQLAATLGAQHVTVTAAKVTARTPRHARRLASVPSPPLSTLVKLMNVPSDDLFAELLTKQLGARFAHSGTIASGAHVISDAIADYGLHPRIVDGSGLSHDDRSSPREVVELLQRLWHTSVGRVLARSLPDVGINGTVRRIGVGTTAQGRCIAKTGTLDYVTNLAGYCSSRGHQMVAFALFIDGPDNSSALVLLSQMVAAIARY